ncbi:MAG: hypothetical protein M0R03_18140 [Novosphingobium sp.]|nr:hypothetical protein [Novosphingobium sp.]
MNEFLGEINKREFMRRFNIEKSIEGTEAFEMNQDIMKGIDQEEILEKARTGYYKDNAYNRKHGLVGKKYKKDPKKKEGKDPKEDSHSFKVGDDFGKLKITKIHTGLSEPSYEVFSQTENRLKTMKESEIKRMLKDKVISEPPKKDSTQNKEELKQQSSEKKEPMDRRQQYLEGKKIDRVEKEGEYVTIYHKNGETTSWEARSDKGKELLEKYGKKPSEKKEGIDESSWLKKYGGVKDYSGKDLMGLEDQKKKMVVINFPSGEAYDKAKKEFNNLPETVKNNLSSFDSIKNRIILHR